MLYISGSQCAPTDSQGGRYIMFPMTSQGNMPNNFLFSPCSKNVIAVSTSHVLEGHNKKVVPNF